MADKTLSFTVMNYEVCHYCSHLMREATRDDYLHGCGLVKNSQGKYA